MTPSQKTANLKQRCKVMAEVLDASKEQEAPQAEKEEEEEDASSVSGVFEEDG